MLKDPIYIARRANMPYFVFFFAAAAVCGACWSASFTWGSDRSCSFTGAASTKETASLPGKLAFNAWSSFLSTFCLASRGWVWSLPLSGPR